MLTKGTIARKQPLVFQITTAGSTEDESPIAHGEHEYTENIKSGIFKDDAFYGRIYAIEPGDDWTDPVMWAKANPSLETNGGFLKVAALRDEFNKALNQRKRQPAFKRYHLGLWLSSEEDWMPTEVWERNAGELRYLTGRPCYLGLDLSSVVDLTSVVAVFPDPDDESFDVLPFFWMAREKVRERELADRVPYQQWVTDGLMTASEGEVIDLRDIKKQIEWLTENFDVKELAYDPFHALQLSVELSDGLGIKCIPVAQRYTHMSEPMKKTMELALTEKIRHAGHPILAWNMRCVRARADQNDNIKPVKPNRHKSGKRIDGAVAMILGLSRAMFHKESVYGKRGVITL